MKTIFLTASRRAGWENRLVRMKPGLLTACLTWLMAMPAFGTERTWTGAAGVNWSSPNNWSPVGTPQNGDDLEFLGNDSNDSMINNVSGLIVTSLTFRENNYQLTGNLLTISVPDPLNSSAIDNMATGGNDNTVTINCSLYLPNGGNIGTCGDTSFTLFSAFTGHLILNGNIQIGGTLTLVSSPSFLVPDILCSVGYLEVSGAISGNGDVKTATDGTCTMIFDGITPNTFVGTLFVSQYYDFGPPWTPPTVSFNKQSGVVVPGRLVINQASAVKEGHAGQLSATSTVSIADGSELLLAGFSETIGMLALTNVSADALPSVVDTTSAFGAGTLTINAGISATVDNDHVHPTIRGILNLNGFLPFNINGGSQPGLEIPAAIEGNGFEKTGNGTLVLDGTNTFFGDVEITAGTVQPTTTTAFGQAGPTYGVELNGGNLQMQGLAIGNEPLYVWSSASTLIANDSCSWAGPVTLDATLNVLPQDTTSTGKTMNFTGPITGSGGITMLDSAGYNGTLLLSGSTPNTYTGATTVYGRLLELGKPVFVNACSGPIVVGGGTAAISELRWLNNYQDQFAALTLYANGYVNLINHDENSGAVTFNGGTVDSTGGQFAIYGTLTVNPSSSTATINGVLGLPPGLPPGDAVINVSAGTTPTGVELLVNATVIGGAPYIDKYGAGTMSLTAANTFTGVTLLEAGIIAMDNVGALSAQEVVIAGGATLRMDVNDTMNQGMELSGTGVGGVDGAVQVSPGVNFTINGDCRLDTATTLNVGSGGILQLGGSLYNTGPLTKIGTGALDFFGNSANTYSGDTLINQGTLLLGNAKVPGNLVIGTRISLFGNSGTTATVTNYGSFCIGGPNVTVNGGSLWDLGGYHEQIVSVNLVNGGSIHTSGGVLGLDGSTSATAVTVGPGKSGASVISGNLSFYNGGNCSFVVGSKSQFLVGSPPELDIQAAISDSFAGSFTKNGSGEMRLSSANTINSTMTVNSGKLTVANSSGLGGSPSTMINSNGVLALTGNIVIQNNSLTLNSSAVPSLQSPSGSNVWTGPIALSQTSAVDVEPQSGYLQLPGVISGVGGVTTISSGTLQFGSGSNANTYTGLTTVTSGVLEAGRFRLTVKHNPKTGVSTTNESPVTAIPGDAVIGSDAPGAEGATLRSLRVQQFSGIANFAVHASGLIDLPSVSLQKDAPAEFLRTLTGSGQVNIGTNSSFAIVNDVPFAFYGAINGIGQFTKEGAGTMTTWGDVNTTGTAQVLGGDWELFGARHNGTLLVSDGNLSGDGTVDQMAEAVVATIAVKSHFPDHQGSTLHLGSLKNDSAVTVQLDMYGPSPTGGNDQIATTTGGVALNNDTLLQTSFSYPPHTGDVIDLIHVPNGQTITGTFANYPDGVVTLVGTTPVLPSYEGGGSGHDFTLTVTNLALAYVSYVLAEGNGNQTVEPNECNLLYVTLANRRSSALTITNAFLRATNTIGVLVTIPVASFPTIPAGQTMENLTPFQFSTDTNLGCGASVGFELVVGAVNEGQFAINFSPVSGNDCSHPTGPCDSCNVVFGQFTTNSLTTTQPLYFVGAPSICYPPKAYPGTNPVPLVVSTPYLTHGFTNSTTNMLCVTAQLDFTCPAAPTNALGVAAYLGTFDTNNPANGYLGDIGQGGPTYPAFSFQVPAGTNFTLVVMAQTNLACNSYALELFGLPCAPPVLAIQPEATPAKVRVNWSSAYPGYTAQQSGKLGGTFVNASQTPVILNSRYSLTNLSITTNQFYRLKK